MPRGAWKAPGIIPSRSSSRTSRMSTNTVCSSPILACAAWAEMPCVRAVASASSVLTLFFSFMVLAALQCAPDHQALDVACTLVDLAHPHRAPQPLDREVGDVAVAAVDLDRVRAHLLGHLGGEQLGHRSLLEAGLAGVAQRGGVEVQLAGGLDLGRHVGEAEIDRLVPDQRLAHALALLGVG